MSSLQMISLRGSAALSDFRLDKILTALKATAPRISHLYAEFWHFAWSETTLTAAQQDTLKKILTYGPKLHEEQPQGELLLVVPRPGTISPWASRATDYCPPLWARSHAAPGARCGLLCRHGRWHAPDRG